MPPTRSGRPPATSTLAGKYDARVRLTGPVPIANEEFATVADGAVVNGIGTVLVVLFILWMALHSAEDHLRGVRQRSLSGCRSPPPSGLMMVGSLNLLSIAFAVLFVGLGVDFGIQFSVRYRSERFKNDNLQAALEQAADYVAVPLSLAAMATAAGFLSFLPTDYKGVSELGEIAGVGMLVAFSHEHHGAAGAAEPAQSARREGSRSATRSWRRSIISSKSTASPSSSARLLVAIAGLPLLYFLKFDFNPINLRSPKVELIATFLDLRKDPNTGANAINVMTNSESRRQEDRSAAGEGAGSASRHVAGQFRAR